MMTSQVWATNGYVSQFYNSKQPISILQKPIEAFISDLHSFIIVSLIAGPIIFVISIKHFGGNKSDKRAQVRRLTVYSTVLCSSISWFFAGFDFDPAAITGA